jgi:type IV pilus assembly protein PilX
MRASADQEAVLMRCRRAPQRALWRVHQRGAVLIVGLLVLLVITMIGVSQLQSTVLQERMAGNLRQNNLALQAAEAALQAGLTYIEQQRSPPAADDVGSNLVWTSCSTADASVDPDAGDDPCGRFDRLILPRWRGDLAQAQAAGASYAEVTALRGAASADELPGLIAQPRIYIEVRYLPPLDVEQAAEGVGVHHYTVSAVGFGASEQARVILQSTIAKAYQL